ncbi:MAG: undecaprenyldiphospho-muramoylpentapeptide beta-N-acetylglucosaminyltransferase [Pseudomonadota bacterium]
MMNQNTQQRAVIAAAGTGGHVFPALAVALQLIKQGWQVDWVGTDEGRLESTVVPAHHIALHNVAMSGIRGHGALRLLKAPLQLLGAIKQSRQLLRHLQPDVVITFGGYVCAPLGIAAKTRGIALVTHEQNAVPGMTTRLLAPFADKVLAGLPFTKKAIKKAVLTGNPLREDVLKLAQQQSDEPPPHPARLLIVGGSLGAKVLNETVPQALAILEQPIEVMHQCGAGHHAAVTAAYAKCGQHQVQVSDFIEQMGAAYQWADLVICRAGALTVAELAVLGKAAIFVPLPHAVDDHQTENAKTLVNAGAAILLPQSQLTAESLAKQLQRVLQDPQQLWKMARLARHSGRPQATADVTQFCVDAAKPKVQEQVK